MASHSEHDEKVVPSPNEKVSHEDSHSDATTGSPDTALVSAPPVEPDLTPVSFFALFRFSTKLEIFADIIGIICAIAAGAAQPLMSLLFGRLTQGFVEFGQAAVEAGKPGANADAFARLDAARSHFRSEASKDASYLVYIGLGMFITTYTYMLIWTYTGEVNSRRIRERYLKAVLRQDVAFFDNLGAGEVATRIQTDTHLIQMGISEKVALVFNFLGAFFTGFILAYARSWLLSLAISAILPCIAITGAIMQKFVSKYMQQSLKHIADGGTFAEEVISTIRTAQAFGTQKKLGVIYNNHVAQAFTADLKAAAVNGVGLGIFFFVIYSAYALAFYFGTTLILQHKLDVGVVVNVFLSILIGSFSLALLAPEAQAITHARGAAAKIFATIDRVPSIDSESEEGLRPGSVKGEIALRNAKFHYPSRPDVPILKGLDLDFAAGKTTALVGASGSGKSTIVSLVTRFYDVIEGIVTLDGVNVKDLNVRWLRSQIGLVSQEPTLFATTIRGNVAHGLIGSRFEGATEAEKDELIKKACEKANASVFIEKLPEGYNTMVGERGFLLSGGQKQRIAIARAIVSDPAILLLDEATSALDTQSEGIVQDALNKAAKGRTTITIAHRLSTIKDADRIYVMGDGRVLEYGTHDELLTNSPEGPYALLVNGQKLREASQPTVDSSADPELPEEAAAGPILNEAEVEAVKQKEIPLGRVPSGAAGSIASEVLKQRAGKAGKETEHSLPYLFKRMYGINRDDKRFYVFGIIASILSGLIYPAFGIVYGITIQSFQATDPKELRHNGDRNALWFFLISIVSMLTIGYQNYAFARAASTLTRKLRSLSLKAIFRQDVGWFDEDKHSTGSLVSNLSDAPQKVFGLAGVTLGALIQSIATIIGGAIVGLAYGWKLALVGIATIPFVVSAGYIRLRVVVLKDQTNKQAHEDSAQVACEAAGAIRTVASLTREQDCYEEYSRSLEGPLRTSNRSSLYSTALFALSQSMTFFAIALVFWFGSRLVSDLEYSTKQFFICLMGVTFGAIQAGNVFSFVPDISQATSAGNDMIHLIDSVPEIDGESEEGIHLDSCKGHIVLQDVHFRYPTRPAVRVLRSMDMDITPGSYVAIVGASGSGKSTVIQLLERFYDPLAGKVLLDGQDITELNVQSYRKQIALVSQEPTLYAGTIRFNILLGAIKPPAEVTQEEIERACKDANIYDFIMSLPKGFDTEVGGKGSQLSGGQKQRIAIARALLRNPKVLLLDEATSALDSNSEKVVQAALDNAAKGRTTIAIAHRLSTIQNADCIYFVKEGRVAEAGTHDELLHLRGGYFELVQLQALSKADAEE